MVSNTGKFKQVLESHIWPKRSAISRIFGSGGLTVKMHCLRVVAAALVWGLIAPATAQQVSGSAVPPVKLEELTPEELQEREARKACKVKICAAFHNRTDGADITCNVLKSWRKEQLSKLIEKAKVSWPWGRVRCVADISLKRDTLIRAMTEERYEAALERQQVTCEVERDKEGNAEIKFEFSPQVTFEKGKATQAALNWGKIEAPTLVKGAMWTATATDNKLNVLQSTLVEDINNFIQDKCMEVKDAWAGK